MADIFDPTGQRLLDETVEKIYPDAPAVEQDNPDIIEGQGSIVELPSNEIPSNEPLINEVSELERLNVLAQQATEEPAVTYRPLNAYVDITPLTSEPSNEFNAEAALQTLQPSQDPRNNPEFQRAIANYIGSSSNGFLNPGALSQFSVPVPSQPWQTDYARIGEVWQERANRVQARAVAESLQPFSGVTRSLVEGRPFGNSAFATAREFLERTTGASFEGIEETEREETEPNNWWDRAASLATQIATPGLSLARAILNPLIPGERFDVPPFGTPDDFGTARRIARDAAAEVGERSLDRIQDVGLPQFLYENTFANITGENFIRSRIRAYERGSNPFRIFLDEPQTFVGLNYYGELSPDQDNSFFAGLAERSPDFRNLIRDLQPQLDAAGRANFNPGAGYFGEFGNAGSLSALLYLANIPEGLITGALYDVADLTRLGVSRTPLAGILSRVNPLFATPPSEEQLRRIDTLGAFVGRDTGFTQEWSEDKYLAFIGNPVLDWVPEGFGLQTGAGFIADLVVGGIADLGIDSIIRRASVRASRSAATEAAEESAESAGAIVLRQSDSTALSRRNVTTEVLPVEPPTFYASPNGTVTVGIRSRTPDVVTPPPAFYRPLSGYVSPTSVSSVQRDVLRGLGNLTDTSNARVLFRTQNTERYTRNFSNTLFNSPSLARRLESPLTTNVRGFSGATIDVIGRRVPVEPEVFIRLADTNADVNAFISNGRRTIFSAKPDADILLSENNQVRRLTDQLTNIRRQIDDNESLMADIGNRPRRADDEDEGLVNLELNQLEQINENLRSAESRLQSALRNINATREDINSVNSELARLSGATETGSFVRDIADDIPLGAQAIRVDDILPLNSRFPADSVLQSFVAPLSMTDQFAFARRSNEDLLALGRLWGDAGTIVETTPNRTQLSDIYRLRYLQSLDPELYARAAKSLPTIDPQRNVIDVAEVGNNRVSMVAEVQEAEPSVPGVDPNVPLTNETRKLVEDEIALTSKYFEDIRKRLNARLSKGQPTQQLPQQLEEAKALMNRIFADYPELAEQRIIQNLPDELRPAGVASERIAPEYAVAQQQIISVGQELQRMQIDLMELEDVVEQTQQHLSSLPQLQRINPADEFATRRMNGDLEVPTATSELAKPVPGVRINEEQLDLFSPNAQLQPSRRQRARARAQAEVGVDNEDIGNAILDIRADNFIEGVDYEPDVRAIRQIVSRVESMTYRQVQAALKAYPGVRRVGTTEELKERLIQNRIKDYRRADIANDDNTPRIFEALGVNIREPDPTPLVVYHGTRAENLDIPSTSLTNEYGIGLYATTNSDDAWRYAKAQPVEDLVDLDLDFRTPFGNQPRVFEVEASRSVLVDNMGQQNPLDFVIVNMDNPRVQDEYRQIVLELLQNYEPRYASRFRNWAKNKHPNQFLHYIRSQFLKDNRGQLPHFEFMQLLNTALRSRDIDALKDGDNLVILTRNYEVGSVSTSEVTLEQGLRNRIAVDQDLAARVPNKTTETILAQDDLSLAVYARNNMRNAVADQEREALDTVRSLNEIEQQLDDAVRADNVVNEQVRLDDIGRDASRQGSASLRNDDVCL